MNALEHARTAPPMVLGARTAADLMTPNPVSIHHGASAPEAAAFLAACGIGAAPVIDEAGRPIGVVSRTDVLLHQGERAVYLVGSPEYYERLGRPVFCEDGGGDAASVTATVRDLMTPAVFSVRPETPAAEVVEQMLALEVRRLFVVDGHGVLVGVISAVDVLRRLRPAGAQPAG